MRIVILDGYTTNPGDLCWDKLKELGECTIYDRTAPGEVLERAAGAEAILTNKVVINSETMAALPDLKYIGVMATGYNVVDINAARERGIIITNIPAYSTPSVGQMVFAHILNITQQVRHYSEEVSKGNWSKNPDFCFYDTPLIELLGKKIGIVGLGQTGYNTARIAIGFGMKVWAYTSKSRLQLPPEIRKAELDQLFHECDIISLHCPLFPSTEGIINRDSIAKMKDGVKIINTSRGPLIVEKDLREALDSGKVSGAAVDVVSTEPIREDNPLLGAKNMIITPHIAWAPRESRQRLMDIAVDNLKHFVDGAPQNVVNK